MYILRSLIWFLLLTVMQCTFVITNSTDIFIKKYDCVICARAMQTHAWLHASRHTHGHSWVCKFYVCVCFFHVEHSLGCGNLMSPPDWEWQPWWGASSICVDAEMHKSRLSVTGRTVKWRVHVTNGSVSVSIAERACRITLKDLSGGLLDILYIYLLFL